MTSTSFFFFLYNNGSKLERKPWFHTPVTQNSDGIAKSTSLLILSHVNGQCELRVEASMYPVASVGFELKETEHLWLL